MNAPQDRPGIGGSEVSAVLGLSPFATPLDLWRRKVLREEEDETPAIRAGKRFEEPILQAYAATQPEALVCMHPERTITDGWRRYSPDAINEDRGWVTLVARKMFERVLGEVEAVL